MLRIRIAAGFLFTISLPLTAATFDVKSFGAKADGKSNDREAIRKAIDAAAAVSGGVVYFPAGTYSTGSIQLKSNITLQLEHGTVLEASAERQHPTPPSRTSGTSFRIEFGIQRCAENKGK
jgi:polygalacturonase